MALFIQSRGNDRVKYARRLAASGGFREEEGLFFAEGRRLCLDLAENFAPRMVFYTEELQAACEELQALGGEHFVVSGEVAEKLGETKQPQGLFCLFEKPTEGTLPLEAKKGVLLCEGLQDPANVGAVIRSAAAFGYGGVLLAGGADPFGPKALRASAGAVGRVPLFSQASLAACFARLTGKVPDVIAAAAGGEDVAAFAASRRKGTFVLLVGNEGAGLSKEALDRAERRVGIPMENGVESLNAAVAASVLMYALKREYE